MNQRQKKKFKSKYNRKSRKNYKVFKQIVKTIQEWSRSHTYDFYSSNTVKRCVAIDIIIKENGDGN